MIFCSDCGHGNAQGSRFCSMCGKPLAIDKEAGEEPFTPSTETVPAGAGKEPVSEEEKIEGGAPHGEKAAPPPPPDFHPGARYRAPDQYAPYPSRKTDVLAIIALVFAIMSFIYCPFVGGVIAVILGYMSLSNIEKSSGALSGEELAKASIIFGWVNIGISLVLMLVLFGVMFAARLS